MRLLIVTQKVDKNDAVLGFMHRWIEEFSRHCDQVTVICLFKGEASFSSNVSVFSLGKESGGSRLKYLRNFYRVIFRERDNYDHVLVHMNPIYVILAGFFWRMWNKKIGMWYAHGYVDLKLKISEKLAHIIFTPSIESFRLLSKKVVVVGHGIDVDFFQPKSRAAHDFFHVVSVGRISPIKDYETLIAASGILFSQGFKMHVSVVGGAGTEDQKKYSQKILNLAADLNEPERFIFTGPVPYRQINDYLQQADLFINLSSTGSLDKAVLEAMACGIPVLTCNESFISMLGPLGLIFSKGDVDDLVRKIKFISAMDPEALSHLRHELRSRVLQQHNIKNLVPKIIQILE